MLFETTPGYYQNFTWYPFMWQGGGEFQTEDGKSAFNSPATVQALKLWQDAINPAPRRARCCSGGCDIVANLGSGYCAMQNVGIWGISAMDNNAKDVPYGIFKLPTPAGGKYVTVGGGWAFVANAKGKNPEAAAQFCAWALASMDQGSVERVVDWCTVAKSDMPPRNSALKAGADAFNKGKMGIFSNGHPSRHPRRAARAAGGLQDHLRRHPGGAARRQSTPQQAATAASQQLDAFLAVLQRRADPLRRWTSALRSQTESAPAGANDAPPARLSRAKRREQLAGYLFVLPDALGLLVFVGVPMVLALGIGFFEVDGFGGYNFVGLRQLRPHVARPAVLAGAAGHARSTPSMLVPALYVSGLGLALLVQRTNRFNAVMRALFFAPQMVSLVVVALVWQLMLVDKIGIVSRLGAVDRPRRHLAPRRPQPRAVHGGRRQRVVPDGLLHADLPRRPAGHPERILRGGPDRRRRAGHQLLVHHAAAAQARPASSCCWCRWSRRSPAARPST